MQQQRRKSPLPLARFSFLVGDCGGGTVFGRPVLAPVPPRSLPLLRPSPKKLAFPPLFFPLHLFILSQTSPLRLQQGTLKE